MKWRRLSLFLLLCPAAPIRTASAQARLGTEDRLTDQAFKERSLRHHGNLQSDLDIASFAKQGGLLLSPRSFLLPTANANVGEADGEPELWTEDDEDLQLALALSASLGDAPRAFDDTELIERASPRTSQPINTTATAGELEGVTSDARATPSQRSPQPNVIDGEGGEPNAAAAHTGLQPLRLQPCRHNTTDVAIGVPDDTTSLVGSIVHRFVTQMFAFFEYMKAQIGTDCEICYEWTTFLASRRNNCGHRCCKSCWRRYLATNENETLARMRHTRAYTLHCWSCEFPIDRRLLYSLGPQSLVQCAAQLDKRNEFIRRRPQGYVCVECPQSGCVGVGYDDHHQRTIMCFLCEHQWTARHNFLSRIWAQISSWWPQRIDGVSGWRPCPHCGAAIQKNGGCAMMRCAMCYGTFRWGTRWNTLGGVIEEHAPRVVNGVVVAH